MKTTYAIITGAAGGLGKSFCMTCAAKGFNLILIDVPGTNLKSLAEQLAYSYKIDVKVLHIDFCISNSLIRIQDLIESEGLNVSLLINNAGIGLNQSFESLSFKQISDLLDVNIRATTQLSYLILPFLEQNEKSFILNVGSMAGFYALPNKSIYSGSKAFVGLFTLSLRMEVAKRGVSVSLLCPGGILSNVEKYWIWKNGGQLVKWSYLHPDTVASIALERTIKGRAIIMPGFYNRLLNRLTAWIPWFLKEIIAKSKFKISNKSMVIQNT